VAPPTTASSPPVWATALDREALPCFATTPRRQSGR
jgi:hypothetical protein